MIFAYDPRRKNNYRYVYILWLAYNMLTLIPGTPGRADRPQPPAAARRLFGAHPAGPPGGNPQAARALGPLPARRPRAPDSRHADPASGLSLAPAGPEALGLAGCGHWAVATVKAF